MQQKPDPSLNRPPDQEVRDQIVEDLDTSILVEASAGTGKTTSLVGRMIALVRTGRSEVQCLAAVTFTRKAAAELRGRFQADLEKAVLSSSGIERARLETALQSLAGCYIGTIHGFCALLLRERPVEAGIDPGFKILEKEVDQVLREQAWRRYVEGLYSKRHPLVAELEALGLEAGELKRGFERIAESPDIDWPAERVDPMEPGPISARLQERLGEVKETLRGLPEDPGRDDLLRSMQALVHAARRHDTTTALGLFEVLSECEVLSKDKPYTLRNWPGAKQADQKQAAQQELERWNKFAGEVAAPYVERFLARRYEAALRTLKPALEVYTRARREAGGLNNQDLLMKCAELLRGSEKVRAYFQRRIRHLLVDEFQDTDPIQAEVMLLLTNRDARESDWRKCSPRPGALFIVGDPKQSIYRFRRADITTYQEVRDLLVQSKGRTLRLTANFRSGKKIIDWVNEGFRQKLGETATEYQPAYSPIEPGRTQTPGEDQGLFRNDVSGGARRNADVVDQDTKTIARVIRSELDRGRRAADFLVLTAKKKHLPLYARALQRLGAPVRITGGVFGSVDELRLLGTVLRAVIEPHNPVALVAALRGEAFGIDDAALYAWRRAGLAFSIHARRTELAPEGLEDAAAPIEAALSRLASYASWLRRMPSVAAFRRIAADLGLLVRAACEPGGSVQAGTLLRVFEVLRGANASLHFISDLVGQAQSLFDGETDVESTPALSDPEPGVRIMNLHKAKGLESPVVFLADPSGADSHRNGPEVHVNRKQGAAGYVSIREPKQEGGYNSQTVLAEPAGWSSKREEEEKFLEAEQNRLLYVAATRAREKLVISFRPKNENRNPWTPFKEHTASFQPLRVPDADPPPVQGAALDPAEIQRFADAASERWRAARVPSWRVGAAKTLSVAPMELAAADSSGEKGGAGWGSVIHLLLETAMRSPEADLMSLARQALREEDMSPDLAEEAVRVVQSVVASRLWQRARAAERCWTEVPFELCAGSSGPERESTTLLVRGVIDLVFKEAAGWVIADYKTDRAAELDANKVVEHYRGQLNAYRSAWTQITGEPVHETGLYFTRTGEYRRVEP